MRQAEKWGYLRLEPALQQRLLLALSRGVPRCRPTLAPCSARQGREAGAVNRTLLQALARLRVTRDGFTAIRNLSPSSRRRPGPSLESFGSTVGRAQARRNEVAICKKAIRLRDAHSIACGMPRAAMAGLSPPYNSGYC